MNTHLSEDELTLHFYGETDRADESRVASHLASCADCQLAKDQLARVMMLVDTAAPVEAPEGFERVAWARLEPQLDANRGGGWKGIRRNTLWLPQWAFAGGVAALLVAAFWAGRISSVTPVSPSSPGAVAAFEPERVLHAAVGDHLDRTQMMLVELVNAESDHADLLASEQSRAAELVAANRVIRASALQSGDTQIVDVLEDLERVLLEIANAPADATSKDITDLQSRITTQDLLFRLRVIAAEMRQRNDRTTGDQRPQRMPIS